jgi:hypothetical protein
MIFKLTDIIFDNLLKYVTNNNLNSDACRCNRVELKTEDEQYYEITICFNENKKQIAICEIYCEGIAIEEIDYTKCFELLMRLTQEKQKQNDNLYDFYKKKIEPITSCCFLNQ